jgi:hypothetical protein
MKEQINSKSEEEDNEESVMNFKGPNAQSQK